MAQDKAVPIVSLCEIPQDHPMAAIGAMARIVVIDAVKKAGSTSGAARILNVDPRTMFRIKASGALDGEFDEDEMPADWRKVRAEYFGWTGARYAQKYHEQNGLCDICGDKLKSGNRTHRDHDHATGAPRGLLCLYCNGALGRYENHLLPNGKHSPLFDAYLAKYAGYGQ